MLLNASFANDNNHSLSGERIECTLFGKFGIDA